MFLSSWVCELFSSKFLVTGFQLPVTRYQGGQKVVSHLQ